MQPWAGMTSPGRLLGTFRRENMDMTRPKNLRLGSLGRKGGTGRKQLGPRLGSVRQGWGSGGIVPHSAFGSPGEGGGSLNFASGVSWLYGPSWARSWGPESLNEETYSGLAGRPQTLRFPLQSLILLCRVGRVISPTLSSSFPQTPSLNWAKGHIWRDPDAAGKEPSVSAQLRGAREV